MSLPRPSTRRRAAGGGQPPGASCRPRSPRAPGGGASRPVSADRRAERAAVRASVRAGSKPPLRPRVVSSILEPPPLGSHGRCPASRPDLPRVLSARSREPAPIFAEGPGNLRCRRSSRLPRTCRGPAAAGRSQQRGREAGGRALAASPHPRRGNRPMKETRTSEPARRGSATCGASPGAGGSPLGRAGAGRRFTSELSAVSGARRSRSSAAPERASRPDRQRSGSRGLASPSRVGRIRP